MLGVGNLNRLGYVCVLCLLKAPPRGVGMNAFWPSRCHDIFVYLEEVKYIGNSI